MLVVLVVLFLQVVRIDDRDVVADPNVFVDDGVDDGAVIPDSDVGHLFGRILFQLFDGFKTVGAHDDGMLDRRAAADPASNSDNGVLDIRTVQDAALGNNRLMNIAVVQFGSRQISGMRIDGHCNIIEVELAAKASVRARFAS